MSGPLVTIALFRFGRETGLGPICRRTESRRGQVLRPLRKDRFSVQLRLAQAYLDFGHPEKAGPVFEKLSETYNPTRQFWTPESVKLHYYLGQVYDAQKWYDKASAEYGSLLRIWATADIGINEVSKAKERLQLMPRQP